MKRLLFCTLALLLVNTVLYAQFDSKAGNPFAAYGYKAKVGLATGGRFAEFHDLEDVVQIGSVLFDTRTKKMVGEAPSDTLPKLPAQLTSMWLGIDPLAEKYYHISPYAFCANNPIRYIDPDGRDWYENTETGAVYYNNKMGKNDAGKGAMKGDGWRHMGANGMFTQKDGVTGSDAQLVAQNGGSISIKGVTNPFTGQTTSVNMEMMMEGGGTAENFMSGQGYNKMPLLADVHVTETTQNFADAQGPIAVSMTYESEYIEKVYSTTYAKKGNKGSFDVLGNYDRTIRDNPCLFPYTTRENRFERRQYDYNRAKGFMGNDTFGSLLKIGADAISIILNNKKK